MQVPEDHVVHFYSVHECDTFMQAGAPCHRAKKKVMKWVVD